MNFVKVGVYRTSFEPMWSVVGSLAEEVRVFVAVVINNCELDGTPELICSDALLVLRE